MTNRRLLVVPALVAGALVAQAGLAEPARAATIRYAAPGASSANSCGSPATACSIDKAVNQAAAGDEVVLVSGVYNTGTTSLTNGSAGVNVHGIAGQPRPLIVTAADFGLSLTGSGAQVADLTISQTGGIYGLNVFGSSINVQRVEVHSTAPVACFFGYSGRARDSLCVNGAASGIAVDDSWGGGATFTSGTLVLRNITAIATGTASYGIRADGGDNTNLDISARNVLASGVAADIRSTEVANNSESDVLLTNSNYDKIQEAGGGNVTNVGAVGSNQTALPLFSETVNYHQAAGSPTIDKGGSDSSVGATDIDGDLRKVGSGVDIGADEFVPDTTPPNVAFDRTPKHRTNKRRAKFRFHASEPVTFYCVIDKRPMTTCSSPLKFKLRKRGKHTIILSAIDAAGNADPSPTSYTWKVRKKKRRGHHRPHH